MIKIDNNFKIKKIKDYEIENIEKDDKQVQKIL